MANKVEVVLVVAIIALVETGREREGAMWQKPINGSCVKI